MYLSWGPLVDSSSCSFQHWSIWYCHILYHLWNWSCPSAVFASSCILHSPQPWLSSSFFHREFSPGCPWSCPALAQGCIVRHSAPRSAGRHAPWQVLHRILGVARWCRFRYQLRPYGLPWFGVTRQCFRQPHSSEIQRCSRSPEPWQITLRHLHFASGQFSQSNPLLLESSYPWRHSLGYNIPYLLRDAPWHCWLFELTLLWVYLPAHQFW